MRFNLGREWSPSGHLHVLPAVLLGMEAPGGEEAGWALKLV
jgi:hypothetical protein